MSSLRPTNAVSSISHFFFHTAIQPSPQKTQFFRISLHEWLPLSSNGWPLKMISSSHGCLNNRDCRGDSHLWPSGQCWVTTPLSPDFAPFHRERVADIAKWSRPSFNGILQESKVVLQWNSLHDRARNYLTNYVLFNEIVLGGLGHRRLFFDGRYCNN